MVPENTNRQDTFVTSREPFLRITSATSEAALQVLLLLLAGDLRVNHDFWVNPIPVMPPFIVCLRAEVPAATLATLRAAVAAIPDAMMG